MNFNFGTFIKTFFRPVLLTSIGGSDAVGTVLPPMTGAQGVAVKSISEHFTAIGTILTEGKLGDQYGPYCANKLYEAKLAVDAGISHGWNGGVNN